MERRESGKYYKVESKEYNTEDEIKERIKQISRNLAYIKRRDAVSLSFGTDGEQDDLEAERDELRKQLNKLKRSSKKIEDKKLLVEDLDEAFYEKVCRAYVDSQGLEWVAIDTDNNSVLHGYFADDEDSEDWEYGNKLNSGNIKDFIADRDGTYHVYDNWEDLYKNYIKNEIKEDIHDIGVYDYDNKWDFYISKEDLEKLGIQYNLDESVEKNNNGGFYKDGKYYLGDPDSDEYDEVTYEGDIADKLWTAACCGDNRYLQNYYDNGGKSNIRHKGFGGDEVSLIIGALNNKCYDTVELLINNGETILPDELTQYKRLMSEYKYEDEITRKVTGDLKESKKVTESDCSDLYDELSRVLTDYEGNGDTELKDDPKPLYDMLVKIQDNWEDVIISKVEESKGKTWDEIFKDAEGQTFGQRALKIKDQARAELEDLMKKDGINVEDYDGVEDAIDDYLKTHDIRFADNGCIITETVETNKTDLYNELSRVLTDYEGNGNANMKDDPKPLYNMLVKIQNNWEDVVSSKIEESVISDYTLKEIQKVLDSEETEYGYSLKITNSGADVETRTLDIDKSDLQAIYDALAKNKKV